MSRGERAGVFVAIVIGCAALAHAQDPDQDKQQKPQMTLPLDWGYENSKTEGDAVDVVFANGIRFASGTREIRAETAVVRFDRDAYKALFERSKGGLPTRGVIAPDPRRILSGELIMGRLESFLQSLGTSPATGIREFKERLQQIKSIYLEGNIVVIDAGVEILTAKSLMFSVPDNRAVFKDVELRLTSKARRGPDRLLIIRAPKLVKQGIRTTGRKVSVTTCSAGKPHFEVLSGEIEIIERTDEFEIISRDNTLAFSGRRTVALPNAHFFTSDQNQILIKGFKVGYSQAERWLVNLDLGVSMNETGGAIHEFLTGRPAGEFRGDWRLGLTWNEVRGTPFDAELSYRGGKLYEGSMTGFYLPDDGGPNLELIRTYLDGTRITETERSLFSTENRVFLAKNWTLDLSAFIAGDPAVYSEFQYGRWHEYEVPETSAHLRHADDNRLFTLTGRTNLTTFTYGDDRALQPEFKEELPLATYDIFTEPLFSIGETDVVLTSSTEAGVFRHEFDSHFAPRTMDQTFRFDQQLEVASPFHWGPFAVRPHTSARFTYYDNSVTAREFERWAFDAGISLTTRLARSWKSLDEEGHTLAVRHTMYPSISFGHLFKVDGMPTDFFQFDEIDSLNENGVVRVGLLNRFHKFRRGKDWSPDDAFRTEDLHRTDVWRDKTKRLDEAREFFFLDVAQNFAPISDRDNNGHVLGLFEYEMIWRPMEEWIPVPNLRVLVEGEHDWNANELRTLNTAMRFGKVLGVHWYTAYRTDQLVRGTFHYGATTDVLGRWTITASGAQDLDRREPLDYGMTLMRRDHDWTLRVGFGYSIVRDEFTFNIRFEPMFGGLFRNRARDFAGTYGRGADALLNY